MTDLYTPEVASTPKTNPATEGNDDLKVTAVLNEINGLDHTGAQHVGTPAVFGMNFQAVSVAQKDGSGLSVPAAGGYSADGLGTPRAEIVDAMSHTDASIAQMVAALRHRHLFKSTLIIVSAKHGQSPIYRSQSVLIQPDGITGAVTAAGVGVASLTADDVALLWLNPSSTTSAADTNTAVKALRGAQGLRFAEILAGDSLKTMFNAPGVGPVLDSRVPDVIGLPEQGVIYSTPKPGAKIAEHGGFAFDDTHVGLLVANPGQRTRWIKSAVETTQIAPTILAFLGLDPSDLQAVRMEHTTRLPGLTFGH